MAIKFKVTTSPKKTKILSIEQAEMTKMQEQATAFILQRAFKDNEIFNTVDDICKDTKTRNGLKKIFKKEGISLFSYGYGSEDGKYVPVDIKSPEGKWLNNFYQQQKLMLVKYGNPQWKVYDRDKKDGFMEWITNLVKEQFKLKKDTWNPADIWLIKESPKYREQIKEAIFGKEGKKPSATTTIKKLNTVMRSLFNNEEIVGISLKKISGGTARYEKMNFDEKFFKNLESKSGVYLYRLSIKSSSIKLGWDSGKNNFESADAHIVLKDSKGNDNFDFQLKGNTTSHISNLKFEPKSLIAGAALIGQAPVDLLELLVKSSPDVPNELYNPKTKTHAYYPKTVKDFNKKEADKYSQMLKNVKAAGIPLGSLQGDAKKASADFVKYIKASLATSKPQVGHTKLMCLHFLDQLLKIKPEPRDNFLTDLVFLAAKKGRSVFEFGPFGKLY